MRTRTPRLLRAYNAALSIGALKEAERIREEATKPGRRPPKGMRTRDTDPAHHAYQRQFHNRRKDDMDGLTGKQLRKSVKAEKHADDGAKPYTPFKARKNHVGRRAKARAAARMARRANRAGGAA